MEFPSIRKVSECFIKPKNVADESKEPYHLGACELITLSLCYSQGGLLFEKLPCQEEEQTIESFMNKLKESLSSALSHFYPLAGRLVTEVDEDQHNSSIFIDCNKGSGVKFVHAALEDIRVEDINTGAQVPTDIMRLFFDLGQIPTNYDAHTEPILAVQVTQLVDGIFLGTSVNHTVVDACSFWHFFSSWSEIFRSNDDTTISRLPVIRQRWFPEGCGRIVKIPYTHPDEFITRYKLNNDEDPITERIFEFSPESVALLKTKANAECGTINKISSFQALSAVVWRSIFRARRLQHDENATCVLIVNGRPRVNPPLSQEYFGNFISPAFGAAKVGELLRMSLGETALLIQKAIGKVTDEQLRNEFMGWEKSPYFVKPAPPINPSSIIISGSTREDVYGVEFGLGKPVGFWCGSDKYDGKVVAWPGKEGKGSVSLTICLSPTTMSALLHDAELLSFLSPTPTTYVVV